MAITQIWACDLELNVSIVGGWTFFEVTCQDCPDVVYTFDTTLFVVTELTPNTTYNFSVKAVTRYYQNDTWLNKTSEEGSATGQTLVKGKVIFRRIYMTRYFHLLFLNECTVLGCYKGAFQLKTSHNIVEVCSTSVHQRLISCFHFYVHNFVHIF